MLCCRHTSNHPQEELAKLGNWSTISIFLSFFFCWPWVLGQLRQQKLLPVKNPCSTSEVMAQWYSPCVGPWYPREKRFWVPNHWLAGWKPCWPSATELDFGEFPTTCLLGLQFCFSKNNQSKPLRPLLQLPMLGGPCQSLDFFFS
jgi:hypothetical protein